ncbi:hypothetical protein SUGI_0080040 [Cryptomeria japonica]|nr:hypothetical protein SUGI_0080040 [Cryptomeria japonica]
MKNAAIRCTDRWKKEFPNRCMCEKNNSHKKRRGAKQASRVKLPMDRIHDQNNNNRPLKASKSLSWPVNKGADKGKKGDQSNLHARKGTKTSQANRRWQGSWEGTLSAISFGLDSLTGTSSTSAVQCDLGSGSAIGDKGKRIIGFTSLMTTPNEDPSEPSSAAKRIDFDDPSAT